MLTRAARRRLQHGLPRTLIAEYDRLALPFLCPALAQLSESRRHSRASSTSALGPSPRKRSRSPRPTPEARTHARQLATAADPSPYGAPFDYVPFEGASHLSRPSAPPSQRPLSQLRPKDVSDAANIAIVSQKASPVDAFAFRGARGLSGDVADLQQSVYACVQVGRMDRAASLVRFMNWSLSPKMPELHDAHLRYVSGLMDSILQAPSREKLSAMQKWVELDMRAIGVPVGYQILSYLIKASFLTLGTSRLDRTLRRYMAWAEAEGEEELDKVLADGIFTDAEWDRLLLFRERGSTMSVQASQTESAFAPGSEIHQTPDYINPDPEPPGSTGDGVDTPGASLAPASEAAPLKPVEQKGLGLSSLKQSLVSLTSHNVQDLQDTNEPGKDPRVLLQERLENDVLDSAMQRWREESVMSQKMRAQGKLSSPALGSHVHDWLGLMSAAVKEEIARADTIFSEGLPQVEHKQLLLVAPFLKMLNVEKACAATILAYMESSLESEMKWIHNHRHKDFDGPRLLGVRMILVDIGKAVLKEAQAEKLLQTHKLEIASRLSSADRRRMISQLRRKKPPTAESQTADGEGVPFEEEFKISTALSVKVAGFMLSHLLKAAALPVLVTDPQTGKMTTELQPIGKHAIAFSNGKKLGVLEMNPELTKRLMKEPPSAYIAKHLPMLCPPRPWVGPKDGGYLQTQVGFVRYKELSMTSSAYMNIADSRGDLKQAFTALDILSQTPWRINKDVFGIMTQVWNTGEKFGKIAPANPSIELPPEPSQSDLAARIRWKKAVRSIENVLSSYHSQRCFQNFQLEVARAFLDDTFYCPHNVDFRGRAYPLPPYLNHMGPDYIRALFVFAEGKELGERGLFWLKIHLANVFGFDKASLEDRAAFVDSHLAEIYDSAERPLEGNRWWTTGEDTWQCLAACIELKKALEAPIPSKFVSHLPIQQDGSCNGLQHYAALGGDALGAKQVNLEPGDKPGDVYTGVLDMVKAAVAKDAEKGDPRALLLNGRLTRKCVKQPVMTNVYGVTFVGASLQVRKQLLNILTRSDLEKVELNALSLYVSTLIFSSLREMFSGAHLIQDWLGECGVRISKAITPEQIARLQARHAGTSTESSYPTAPHIKLPKNWKSAKDSEDYQFKSSIVWTTPLGLPIVQPYREHKIRNIETTMQKVTIPVNTVSDAVCKRKQLQGFPPNFIHSLDATHMMLTALRCRERGMTFAAIHDSFWTHASDSDALGAELREAFVNMHSEDIVGRLREEFGARYQGCYYWASVDDSSPAGRAMRAHLRGGARREVSVRAYRTSTVCNMEQVRLVFAEQERQRLLASSDPAEVAAGREMVTPASIYEAHGGDAGAKAYRRSARVEEVPEVSISEELPGELEEEGLESPDETSLLDESVSSAASAQSPPPERAPSDESAPPPSSAAAGARRDPPKKPRRRQIGKLYFWRKLEFPDAPAKGAFDVERVKQSPYFFS